MNNNGLPEAVKKYLNKYASDKWGIELKNSRLFNNIIVIPAIAESENIKILLNSLADCSDKYFGNSLFVFVINNTVSAEGTIKDDNKKSISLIRGFINGHNPTGNQSGLARLNLGVVDACTAGLEMDDKNGGVGLARKIGMDLALRYFDYSSGLKNILVCLDADCTVSSNYLDVIVDTFNENSANAGYARYEHRWDKQDEYAEAIVCYEIFLRYYYLALKYARSPYAIHTIGSTLICDSDAYIKVEGMNKRKAAEDFYFIEKLSKIYKVEEIRSAVVYPSGRGSWRVPFGTGQRVNRYLSHEQDEYRLYSPESFKILRQWNNYFYNDNHNDPAELIEYSKKINKDFYGFLKLQGFPEQWTKIVENSGTAEQISKQKKIWFDGFRTLKLVHHLRDNSFPNINMFDAVHQLFDLIDSACELNKSNKAIPSFTEQIEYLEKLRALT